MPLLTWLALVFFLVAVAAPGTVAVREAFRAFRAFGALGREAGSGLARLESSLAETTRRLDALPGKGERLSGELERLAHSRAQLSLLLARFADVRRTVTGARATVLGK